MYYRTGALGSNSCSPYYRRGVLESQYHCDSLEGCHLLQDPVGHCNITQAGSLLYPLKTGSNPGLQLYSRFHFHCLPAITARYYHQDERIRQNFRSTGNEMSDYLKRVCCKVSHSSEGKIHPAMYTPNQMQNRQRGQKKSFVQLLHLELDCFYKSLNN